MYYQNIKTILLIMIAAIWLSACGTDVGGNEDRTAGVITLTSLNEGGEIIGTFTITWTNDEPNQSFVDIEISSDSGETYQLITPPDPADEPEICVPDFQAIADATAAAGEDADALAAVDTNVEICAANTGRIPDLGAYVWDTNTVSDCRTCRIRLTATDVVGNVSDPAESAEDFIINNVPQVLDSALYFDFGNDGVGKDDTISIPFDKSIDLNALVAGNTFFMPVLDDNIGAFSTMALGAAANEVIITINELVGITEDLHLHIRGSFDATKTNRTAPSGLDILSGLAGEVIFSPETGRTAEPLGDGIDLVPTFGEGTASGILATSTFAVALEDFDDNGTLDAVVINGESPIDQSVYSGNGDGTFSALPVGVQQLGDNFPGVNLGVAVGDVDGVDGPDIVVAIGGFQPNIVYYNNATDGDFVTKAPLSLGNSWTFAVALGDIDGNGSLDLVTGNDGPNRVWRNNGGGIFAEDGTPQTLGNTATADIELADVDGDGARDIIAANGPNEANQIYINNGSGVFSKPGLAFGNSTTLAIAAADVDGDGDIDVASGNDDGQPNRLWLNDGDGVFTDSGQTLGTNRTTTLALIDIDTDGDLDLVTGNDNGSVRNKKVWFNDGEGLFSDSGQAFGANVIGAMALGDLDGDHDIDILEGITDNNISDVVWLNSQRHGDQAIFIDSGQSLGTNDTRGIAQGDVDGDGDLDFVAGNFNQGNRVWLNNINNMVDEFGSFSDSGQSLATNLTLSTALGDIDGDGDLDLVTGNDFGQGNRVWRNDGNGVFTIFGLPLGSDDTWSVVLGDIDGDNDLDLISGNANATNRVWRNNGSGSFSEDAIPQTLGSGITLSLAMADIDGDTDLDVVEADTLGANRVWLNSGLNTGNFVQDQSVGSNITQTVALGDIDDDGDPDLVEGSFNQNIVVWENDGSATNMFVNPQTIAGTNINTKSLELIDLDGDGDLDLIVGNFAAVNRVYINNGKGDFSIYPVRDNGTLAAGDDNDTNSMAVGDFDGDGDPDIITGNSNGQGNRLWLNDF